MTWWSFILGAGLFTLLILGIRRLIFGAADAPKHYVTYENEIEDALDTMNPYAENMIRTPADPRPGTRIGADDDV